MVYIKLRDSEILLQEKFGFNDMSTMDLNSKVSNAAQGGLIDFDRAEIRISQFNGDLILYVTGVNPSKGWKAMLVPRINHDALDYLTVEVLHARVNEKQEGEYKSHYQLSLPLNAISGKKGVKLIGANQIKQIEI